MCIRDRVETLRADPGSRGMVLANGGFLSKESAGVYSTLRLKEFQCVDSRAAQASIDAVPDVPTSQAPKRGLVEAYSVLHQKGVPLFAYAFMREGSERFLARTNTGDIDAANQFISSDPLGVEFAVDAGERRNTLLV